jgi:hypothetical protein
MDGTGETGPHNQHLLSNFESAKAYFGRILQMMTTKPIIMSVPLKTK